jgi:hypothetical protein
MGNWYESGFDGIGREDARISTLNGPGRLWIPPGERREFVFIDDAPAQIYEHNPKLNGSFRNWMTCLKGIEEKGCPVCDQLGEKTRYYCGYFSVIDCSKWKDKKGNDHQFELNLLQAKLKTMKKFKRKKEDAIEAGRAGLAGGLYRATREDDMSPTCGDEFEFVRDPDMSKLFELALYRGKKLSEMFDKAEENETSMATLQKIFQVQFEPDSDGKKLIRKLVPFNYLSVLAPKEYKELKLMVAGAERDNDSRGGDKSDGEVPF